MTEANTRTLLTPEEKKKEKNSLLDDMSYIRETKLNVLLSELNHTDVSDTNFDSILEEIILLRSSESSLNDSQKVELKKQIKMAFVEDYEIQHPKEKPVKYIADKYIKNYTVFENVRKQKNNYIAEGIVDWASENKNKIAAASVALAAGLGGYAYAKNQGTVEKAQREVDAAKDKFERETKINPKTGEREPISSWLKTDLGDKEKFDELKRDLQYKEEKLEKLKQKGN